LVAEWDVAPAGSEGQLTDQARQILIALNQYARCARGDVALMKGKRLDVCAFAVATIESSFRRSDADQFQILKVGHQREIYREE